MPQPPAPTADTPPADTGADANSGVGVKWKFDY